MEKTGKKIIIAERDNIAAVMDGKKVSEFFVTKGNVLLGDIYLANVENILPSIEAAFVDVGVDKMGFLHAQDIVGKGALKDKLKPKQKIIVQVEKEPTGHKGPRVTMQISLPGRFLVLLPNETGINVSKKIESIKERARLKSTVNLMKPVGVGVIIRTEAEGQSESDIQEDLEVLLEKWNNIVTSADTLKPPSLISRDQDLLYRVLREACTDDISEIIVDTGFAMNRVNQLLQNWHMSKNIDVTLYKGSEPLLIATDVHKEIKAALQTKVNLPSGGYLYIQTTEALTVIDVNSGKFTSSATQDETILRTNREAIQEIARQLRLRNIGGMIIVDFIDMATRIDKLRILEEFEIALEPDKSKPQIGQLSDLGLVELTRHRQGQSLSELFTKKCPHCQGSGYMMEELKFSSPTAEGEYRAKASKIKMPISNFKKNIEDTDATQEAQLQENKSKSGRKNKFRNKNRDKYQSEIKPQVPIQQLEPPSEPIVEISEKTEDNANTRTKRPNRNTSKKIKSKTEVKNEEKPENA
ncbi:MAG: Rne/Rng family ribonuclease [Candidatus Gastranaerophilales bacterium]|nr:Rne/Rng family ribonuclease [Candidatus Gastranaerophilales bacterium]